MALAHGAPGHGEAGMCLAEKMRVFDELPSHMSCGAGGHEFNVNESNY